MNPTKTIFRLLLGRRLPTISGTLRVDALRGPVTIRRDSYGIPHIDAEHPLDAWYTLGFCQGQDRAFKIELQQRVARGTISELIGKRGVSIDRLARRVGFFSSAQRQLGVLDPEVVDVLDAFARGVTEGRAIGCKRKPHEYVLLRSDPIEYTATDVVAASKLQAFGLAGNWDVELARLHILRSDGPEALKASTRPTSSRTRCRCRLDSLRDLVSTGFAKTSAYWPSWPAVAGARTAGRWPLLGQRRVGPFSPMTRTYRACYQSSGIWPTSALRVWKSRERC